MSVQQQNEQQLRKALENLESCLETPVLPGELSSWVVNLEQSLLALEPLLARQLESVHAGDFAAILEEDTSLAARVETLRSTDQSLLSEFVSVSQAAVQLAAKADCAESDEGACKDAVEQLIEAGIGFVIDVRKQESAIRTWVMEAYGRDRGAVD